MRRVRIAWLGWAVLGLMACGSDEAPTFEEGGLPADIAEEDVPRVLAQAQCELQMECDCLTEAGPVGEDPAEYALEQCMDHRRLELEFWQKGAQFHELTFDATCLARRFDVMTQLGCGDQSSLFAMKTHGSCADACRIYHGDLPLGADCDLGEGVDRCDQGLFCDWSWDQTLQDYSGTCHRRCVGEGQSCDYNGRCATGLWCNENAICTPLPTVGQACPDYSCFDATCNPNTFTCEAIAEPGQACSVESATCYYGCVDGVCQAGPPQVCNWDFRETYQ